MKKLLVWFVVLIALQGFALQAQNLTGTWQGSLKPGERELRIVIKISLDNDKLKAVFYSIDQGAQPLTASAISQSGSAIKIALAGLGGYEGRLSSDGNSIMGTWTQGMPLPLNLARATPTTEWTIPEPPPPPVRMAANADPGVEVATIKPSDPNRPGRLFTLRGQEVITVNTTVSSLITMAYGLHARQIVGAPAWLESDKYDLTIKPNVPGQPNQEQAKIMIQKLLADRFQLKFHREKQELSVYAITVSKSGAKITKSQSDPNGNPGLFFGGAPHGMSFSVRNATIADVANTLQGSILDKPAVDQTGLPGKYDFTLTFTPDPGMMAFAGAGPRLPAVDNPDAAPDLFTAFEQQLGLKMSSTKAQADVLVIDRVEKPSAN
jgi:uncharacterized protein (TIGR03435 family)